MHSKEESEPVDDDAYGVEVIDGESDSAEVKVAPTLLDCIAMLVVLVGAVGERTVDEWVERACVRECGASLEADSTSMPMSRPFNEEMAVGGGGVDSASPRCRRSHGRGEGREKGEWPKPTEATMAAPERCGVDMHALFATLDASRCALVLLEGVVEVYGARGRVKRAVAVLFSVSNAWWR